MDALVSPSRTVTIGGKDYLLDGSFATLRSVQEHFKQDVLHLLFRIVDLRVDEVAKLISLANGVAVDEIGQAILDDTGALTAAYGRLKNELFAWLNVAICPKADREKKKAEMARLLTPRPASPGPTTSGSPSDPSGGSPASSGAATSGS